MSSFFYKIIKFFVRLFYPRITVEGAENLPDEPCIVVGNHTQMNGPIICELYFPKERYTWCASQMMEFKEVPEYAFTDFWSQKPKWTHPFFRLMSHLIAPLSVCVFNNAKTIPVYRDTRLLTTFRQTIQRLNEGANIVIFPEYDKRFNNILYDFQDKFVDIARFYYRKTGKELCFSPMYIAPKLKKVYFGAPIRFNHEARIEDERRRICAHLMEEITETASSLPEHTVVPYRNIPKRLYPKNVPIKVYTDEKTRS